MLMLSESRRNSVKVYRWKSREDTKTDFQSEGCRIPIWLSFNSFTALPLAVARDQLEIFISFGNFRFLGNFKRFTAHNMIGTL